MSELQNSRLYWFCLDKRFGGPGHLKRQVKFVSRRVSSNSKDNQSAKLKSCMAETLSSIENKIKNISKLRTYALNRYCINDWVIILSENKT